MNAGLGAGNAAARPAEQDSATVRVEGHPIGELDAAQRAGGAVGGAQGQVEGTAARGDVLVDQDVAIGAQGQGGIAARRLGDRAADGDVARARGRGVTGDPAGRLRRHGDAGAVVERIDDGARLGCPDGVIVRVDQPLAALAGGRAGVNPEIGQGVHPRPGGLDQAPVTPLGALASRLPPAFSTPCCMSAIRRISPVSPLARVCARMVPVLLTVARVSSLTARAVR